MGHGALGERRPRWSGCRSSTIDLGRCRYRHVLRTRRSPPQPVTDPGEGWPVRQPSKQLGRLSRSSFARESFLPSPGPERSSLTSGLRLNCHDVASGPNDIVGRRRPCLAILRFLLRADGTRSSCLQLQRTTHGPHGRRSCWEAETRQSSIRLTRIVDADSAKAPIDQLLNQSAVTMTLAEVMHRSVKGQSTCLKS